jgi:hypothetical protein
MFGLITEPKVPGGILRTNVFVPPQHVLKFQRNVDKVVDGVAHTTRLENIVSWTDGGIKSEVGKTANDNLTHFISGNAGGRWTGVVFRHAFGGVVKGCS